MNWIKLGIIAAAVAGLYFGWQSVKSNIWNDGYATHKAEIDKLTAIANEGARELERMNRQSKENALENQKRALVQNIADINLALAESDGLRDDSERSLQAARENHAACLVSATAHKELLGACEGRYTELAGKAQGHVADIKALTEAWPQ